MRAVSAARAARRAALKTYRKFSHGGPGPGCPGPGCPGPGPDRPRSDPDKRTVQTGQAGADRSSRAGSGPAHARRGVRGLRVLRGDAAWIGFCSSGICKVQMGVLSEDLEFWGVSVYGQGR